MTRCAYYCYCSWIIRQLISTATDSLDKLLLLQLTHWASYWYWSWFTGQLNGTAMIHWTTYFYYSWFTGKFNVYITDSRNSLLVKKVIQWTSFNSLYFEYLKVQKVNKFSNTAGIFLSSGTQYNVLSFRQEISEFQPGWDRCIFSENKSHESWAQVLRRDFRLCVPSLILSDSLKIIKPEKLVSEKSS